MKLFYQLKLDAILLPLIALLICLGGWALVAGHGKTTVSIDDWGDKVTKTERFGISKNLPSPSETWVASKPYIVEPFAKRGELDQGILRFAWLSLKLVAQGYAIALILGTPIGFFLGLSKNFTRAFDPIIQILRPVSPLA
jgi:nitrate/nitrite transport system permease protein